MVNVAVVKCKGYEQKEVDSAVSNALKLVRGIKKYVKRGDRVLLKVNLLMPKNPKKAVTTHPAVVEAVIKEVKKITNKIYVGDTSRGINFFAKRTGLKDVIDRQKVKLTDLGVKKEYKFKEGKIIKKFVLGSEVLNYDVIINLPKLKTHLLCTFTGAVKNLFGCIPGFLKPQMHMKLHDLENFNEMLLDLYLLIKPKLNIMDGVVAMEGNGPAAGKPKKVGVILASKNALALDNVACNLIKLKDVLIFPLAKKRGLEGAILKNINVKGDKVSVKDFKGPSTSIRRMPEFVKRIFKKYLTLKPYVIKEKCNGCGTCYKVCPINCIKMVESRKLKHKIPKFNYKICMRCYCCHEFCPQHAIGLKGGLCYRLLGWVFNK